MKKILISALCILMLVACKSNDSDSKIFNERKVARQYILDNKDNSNSIVFWTPDTVNVSHPELAMLLDPLFQFVPSDTLDKDLRFMDNMRKRFCQYYDALGIWSDTVDDYAKVDSVIDYFYVVSDKDFSNMGMMIHKDMFYRANKLRHYGLLQQLIDVNDGEYFDLLEIEWTKWNKLKDSFSKIVYALMLWSYRGGSGSILETPLLMNQIMEEHINLYEEDMKTCRMPEAFRGTFQESAKQFLISCCLQGCKELSVQDESETNDHLRDWGIKYGCQAEIDSLLPILSTDIDNWLAARNKWTDSICHDWNRIMFRHSSTHMLINWALIASEAVEQ